MKISNIDFSQIPNDWQVIPCGYFFREKSIKNNIGEINLSVYRDFGVIKRDSRDDNHNRISEDISNYKLVEKNDFVLNKMKCWMGSLGVSNYRGIVSPSYTVLEPKKKIHNQYFHYLLRSEYYRQIYESLSYGVRVGQWELRFHDFKKIPALYPNIKEQKIISTFLNKKNHNIDLLLEKLTRKKLLLEEYEIVLINQFITKGINSNQDFKRTGVEYIEEIPLNWKIIKLNLLTENICNGTSAPQIEESDYPVTRIETISNGEINPEKFGFLESNFASIENFILNDKDILFSHINSFAIVGQTAIYEKEKHGILFHGMNLLRLRVKQDKCNPYFLHYFLKSSAARFFIRSVSKHAINQVSISISNLSMLKVPLPPLDEQEIIVKQIDKEIRRIKSIREKLIAKIELIKEYRQSLISSVVTGKIRITEDII